jgi:uncharacterized OB-fold protein
MSTEPRRTCPNCGNEFFGAMEFCPVCMLCKALEAVSDAEALVERYGQRWCSAELQRLRGIFLAAIGAEETQIEASLCKAIRIAKEQKSVSLEKRAEATCAEYRRRKANASRGRGFRLPLW